VPDPGTPAIAFTKPLPLMVMVRPPVKSVPEEGVMPLEPLILGTGFKTLKVTVLEITPVDGGGGLTTYNEKFPPDVMRLALIDTVICVEEFIIVVSVIAKSFQ
jgi:hypothetical protein